MQKWSQWNSNTLWWAVIERSSAPHLKRLHQGTIAFLVFQVLLVSLLLHWMEVLQSQLTCSNSRGKRACIWWTKSCPFSWSKYSHLTHQGRQQHKIRILTGCVKIHSVVLKFVRSCNVLDQWIRHAIKLHACQLPRKPFRVFHPGVVARLPAPQASITAKALHVIITTWMAEKQTTECGHYMEGFKGQITKQ